MQITASKISSGSVVYGARSRARRPTRYSLLLKLKKSVLVLFCHRRCIENKFGRLFSAQQRPNVCVSDAWPAPAAYPRPFCEHCCDQRWDLMANSLVLSIDVCRGLGMSPPRLTFGVVFSRRPWPKICPGIFVFGFWRTWVWNIFFEDYCAHSQQHQTLMAGVFEIRFFLATSRFHCYRSTLLYI